MKLKTSIFFFLTFFLFCTFLPVSADDFGNLQKDYSNLLSTYNSTLSDYQVANNTYDTYKTLSSLTQVLEKSKIFLMARDDLLIKHFELLNAKIDLTNLEDAAKKDSLKQIAGSEITFFTNHKSLVTQVATTLDVNNLAGKAEEEIPQANVKSKQILGNILNQKVASLEIPYLDLYNGLGGQIDEIKSKKMLPQSEIDKLGRWMVEVNNKKILADNNAIQNLSDLYKLGTNNGQDVDKNFDTIRINIIQGSLYLKEGVNFMTEILNEIKYQQ